VWTPPAGGSPHDQTIVGDTMWVAHTAGLARVDVSDPASPVTLDAWAPATTGMGYHNAWPSADARWLYTTQEFRDSTVGVWDLANADELALVDELPSSAGSCAHNVYVDETTAYVAWYTVGVKLFDLAEPDAPRLVGWNDTFADEGDDGGDKPRIEGVWGVWPFGEHVVVGDTERGLMVFDYAREVVTRD
jgi:hypothetical protein